MPSMPAELQLPGQLDVRPSAGPWLPELWLQGQRSLARHHAGQAGEDGLPALPQLPGAWRCTRQIIIKHI